MAIDTQSLTKLIADFRQLKAKNSITPESLGYILQRLTDLLGDSASTTEMTSLKSIVEEISNNVAGQVPIYAEVRDQLLYIHGHEDLIEQGYKPFLFRFARKRNINKHKEVDGQWPRTSRKGWLLMGRENVVNIDRNGVASFAAGGHLGYHMLYPDKNPVAYSNDARELIDVHDATDGKAVSWGKSVVYVHSKKNPKKFRMLRFQFAIGFAKADKLNIHTLRPYQLASTLAIFSVIQSSYGTWSFGR